MNKQVMNNNKASKLYKLYELINLVGSCIIRYRQDMVLQGNQDLTCIISDEKYLSCDFIDKLIESSRSIGVAIPYQSIETAVSFQQYNKSKLLPLIKVSQTFENYIKFLVVPWKSQLNNQNFIQILKYLQFKEFCIIIQPLIKSQSWQIFQLSLFHFTQYLESQQLLLSTISILLNLPQLQSANYAKQVLSIWRRTIPTEIGRIIINSESQESGKKIGQMFYIKDLPQCWQIQFLTSRTELCDKLNELSLGLI